ncbi:MAG: MBL fold metallo-hydrolase [Desulfomonile sp.]|jgi:ribonuclease BN (tRNA processing enzyme)
MELTILGSGTATPSLDRNASGLAIRAQDCWILADMGPGTLRRMCEAGIDTNGIDIILLTHFHADHVSDVAPFLFASNYAYGPVREEPFHIIGPQGLEQFYEALVQAFGYWIVPTNNRLIKVEMNAEGPDIFASAGATIRSRPAVHSFPCLSYRIEAEGKSVTVSGDTDFSENLIELAAGSNILVCECSLPDGMKKDGHLVPSDAGRIASEAGVGKLVLTHFYPPCNDVDVLEQAAAFFSGEILKAVDLMVIEV